MPGVKHLIDCHCYLKIFGNSENQVNHKFPVYSKFDTDGKVITKLQKCNNCESLHYVYDLCKSELKPGKDNTTVTLSFEDLAMMLPERLANSLVKNGCSLADMEHAIDILEEERWGEILVLKRDIISEEEQVKILKIFSESKFQLDTKKIKTLLYEEM